MTCSYVAFGPDMLHSPLPFGIQAKWQGSVGCAQGFPTTLISFDILLFCRLCGAPSRCASRGVSLTIWAFRRLPMIYALYTALMVLLPLSANLLNSIARYYLVVFPAFILLALFSRDDKPNRHVLILI